MRNLLDGGEGAWYDSHMINQRDTRTPLPASAWGTEAAKVAAHEDWAYAQGPAAQLQALSRRGQLPCPHCLASPLPGMINFDRHLRFECPALGRGRTS